jgi:hypothetical protein
MVRRTAFLGLLAAMLPVGCDRTDVSPLAAETGTQKTAEPAGDCPKGDRLAKPVPLEVDGKPLVREHGCLFPLVGDFYGDGRQALLLGTFEDGRLLVYRNVGTKVSPRLGAPQWFDDTVPTGRIPRG